MLTDWRPRKEDTEDREDVLGLMGVFSDLRFRDETIEEMSKMLFFNNGFDEQVGDVPPRPKSSRDKDMFARPAENELGLEKRGGVFTGMTCS